MKSFLKGKVMSEQDQLLAKNSNYIYVDKSSDEKADFLVTETIYSQKHETLGVPAGKASVVRGSSRNSSVSASQMRETRELLGTDRKLLRSEDPSEDEQHQIGGGGDLRRALYEVEEHSDEKDMTREKDKGEAELALYLGRETGDGRFEDKDKGSAEPLRDQKV